ncbi:hypothetical protein B0H14DRAFT_3448513 [Mycena olivaceomarginata]|nr:hypothetical protein B0H14DRAFT_3448513 [Mycena olivaceomarginata]
MSTRREFSAASFVCSNCGKQCKSTGGLKRHRDAVHITLPVVNPPIPHPNGAEDPFDTPPQSPGPEIPAQPILTFPSVVRCGWSTSAIVVISAASIGVPVIGTMIPTVFALSTALLTTIFPFSALACCASFFHGFGTISLMVRNRPTAGMGPSLRSINAVA